MSGEFRAVAERRLPGRLCAGAGDGRAGPDADRRRRACSPAPRKRRWLDRYEDAGIPKLSKSIDWGWFEWFMRPIFDLLMFLFHTRRQFRRGDHLPDA